jgi:hypothetical protein
MAGAIDSLCAAGPATGCSGEYHEEVFFAGLDFYGSGLLEYPEKICIYKFPYRDSVTIQNLSSYLIDERGGCKELAEESGHDPYP